MDPKKSIPNFNFILFELEFHWTATQPTSNPCAEITLGSVKESILGINESENRRRKVVNRMRAPKMIREKNYEWMVNYI